MSISQSDQVFSLVKSLTKAEKRNFKLYASRIQGTDDALFIRLFAELDKAKVYNERIIRERLDSITRSQLSNLKRHLYSQLLISLRLIYGHKDVSIKIREQIDFARILYAKGLYMQSLKILERAKVLAEDAKQDVLLFAVLEAKKLIEEKHITRSRTVKNKVEDLIEESERSIRILKNGSNLANLKLKIHGLYIKIGHVKDEKQAFVVRDYFKSNLPKVEYEGLSFFEKVYLHQSYVWYYFILLDFENCLVHASKWVEAFLTEPEMIHFNPDLYMRGLHYRHTGQMQLRDVDGFRETLGLFDKFKEAYQLELNVSSKIILFLYHNYAKLDYFILSGQFREGIDSIPRIRRRLKRYAMQMDSHRILTFYYRFAWLHFGEGEFDNAIDYLNMIIDLKAAYLREDIQCYSWLLFILCHWENKHYRLLTHLLESARRFFVKMKEQNELQKALISFIRIQLKPGKSPDQESLEKLKARLLEIREDPFERKALLYLDAVLWVESKLQGRKISTLVQNGIVSEAHPG